MKKIFAFILTTFIIFPSFASNNFSNNCSAYVTICGDGPGIVAKVTSQCKSTSAFVFGYKKQGVLGNNNYVDAHVKFTFENGSNNISNIRITPDWHNLGFLTAEILYPNVTDISIAFSDGNGAWDSNYGSNYHYAIYTTSSSQCYTKITNEEFTEHVPFGAWDIINEALAK
jgi:hypothetical protein